MAANIPLTNFSKGEIAAELFGRVDTSQYQSALRKARNFVVQKYGGVTFRPGTRFVGKVDDPTKPVRLIPFQFSIDQAYVLVMDQGGMRPVANGGFVLEQNTKITALTNAVNAQLTVAYHGYSVGDRVYLYGITGPTALNGKFAKVVSVIDANNFTIDIDTTAMPAFVSSTGVTNASPPPAPPTPPVVPPVTPDPDPAPSGGGGGGGGTFPRDPGPRPQLP